MRQTHMDMGVEQKIQLRPSLWHLLWGAPFILIGVGLFVYVLLHGITHATDSLTQIVVPGNAQLNLKPGHYTVFLEDESTVNGKVYSTTQSVSGLSCRVTSVKDGTKIPLRQTSMNTTYSVSSRSGHSVLEFTIQQDGRYEFACDYEDGPKGPDVVIAVGSGVGEAIASTILDGFAAILGGFGGAAVVVVVVVLRRAKNQKLSAQSFPRP
jgi:hypothetical protein